MKLVKIVVPFYLSIILFTGCSNRDEEILTMENAPWGKEYQAYFDDLERRGKLIRDIDDSLMYYGTIDKDSFTIVVNPIKWPTKKLLIIELYLGKCEGNKFFGGITDRETFSGTSSVHPELLEFNSGYSYIFGLKKSSKSFNRFKELCAKRYGLPLMSELSALSIDDRRLATWQRVNGLISEKWDSSFIMTYSNLLNEVNKVRDSIAKTLKPKDIARIDIWSSPDLEFVGNKCKLGVNFRPVGRTDFYYKEKIMAVQFDLVFFDHFENEIFSIKNLQYEIPGGGIDNLIGGPFYSVPVEGFKFDQVYDSTNDEYRHLARMKRERNFKPPTARVTAVLFEGGKVVKE